MTFDLAGKRVWVAGALEPTNQWYAIARIAGLKVCGAYRKQYGCDFISAQPTDLYGAFDNFDLRKPDGTPREPVDTTTLKAPGWTPSVPLAAGIADVYRWFFEHGAGTRVERSPA